MICVLTSDLSLSYNDLSSCAVAHKLAFCSDTTAGLSTFFCQQTASFPSTPVADYVDTAHAFKLVTVA